MSDANVIKLLQPGSFADPLTEVLRNGARALLAQAIEAEVAEFLDKHVDLKTATGLRRLVRHGHLPEASTTGFQLQRAMGRNLPGGGFFEPIVAPKVVQAVHLNGITQDPATYSIDFDSGLLSFSTAPASELTITVDFSYYFRCRFTDDKYDFENFMHRLWQLKKLTFISVRP